VFTEQTYGRAEEYLLLGSEPNATDSMSKDMREDVIIQPLDAICNYNVLQQR